MPPQRATKPLARTEPKRAPAKRAPRTTVPPVDTSMSRPPRQATAKRALPATTRKGGAVSAPVAASPFASMKVYNGALFREEPKVVDPEVWKLANHILKSNEPAVVDIHDWTSEDVNKFKAQLSSNVTTHPDFEGGRFYCKRGLLKDTGRAAFRVSLSFPGRESE